MSFTEWYKSTYSEDRHEDYVWLYGLELINGYEEWCEDYNQKPIWNG